MIKLDGSEIDVLCRLGKYGACEDGDLPSKQGMSGLINKGLAIKDYNLSFANALTELGKITFETMKGEIWV